MCVVLAVAAVEVLGGEVEEKLFNFTFFNYFFFLFPEPPPSPSALLLVWASGSA